MTNNDMKNKQYYVGLDIGTTKIVAMIGEKNEFGKIRILGYGQSKSEGINKGVVHNITKTIQSILQAIKDAQDRTGLIIKDVEVGIAGQHILSMQHSDYITRSNPEQVIDEEDIQKLINQVYSLGMQPGQEIIHVLPQEYKVDGQAEIKEPIGMEGSRLEASFHLVIGQMSSIRNIGRCVKSAGLNLVKLTLEPLASAESVLSEEEKEAGVALVDIGGGTTDVAIFKDGIIRHTAVIPMGGNVITDDIKEGCAILGKYAELLKVRFGSAWPGENKENEMVAIPGIKGKEPKEISVKNLSKIIYARMVNILEAINNVIKNYGHDEQKKKLFAGIVLTGGGSQLKHIKQLAEYVTGMDVRIGYPNEHLAGESDERIASPVYATSIGLVMSAIKSHEIQKNELFPIYEDKMEHPVASSETPVEKQPLPQEEDSLFEEEKEKKKYGLLDKMINNSFVDRLKKMLDSAE